MNKHWNILLPILSILGMLGLAFGLWKIFDLLIHSTTIGATVGFGILFIVLLIIGAEVLLALLALLIVGVKEGY